MAGAAGGRQASGRNARFVFGNNLSMCHAHFDMEFFELKYFLGAARFENLHRAAESLRVSPASLSKAVARLESELGVALFARKGRGLELTDPGRLLRMHALEIVALEERARQQLSGDPGTLHCSVAGPEVLLAEFGQGLSARIQKKHPAAVFEYLSLSDADAVRAVQKGESALGLITSEAPRALTSKVLGQVAFQTCVGPGHPLSGSARARKPVPVRELLKHGFVSPSSPFLGQVGLHQSSDGWRDDQFPRRVDHLASSLSVLSRVVASGQAVAYLPDYLARQLGLSALKVTGCPYSCTQTVRLITRDPRSAGWILQLF